MKKTTRKVLRVAVDDDREENTSAEKIPLTKAVGDFDKKMKIYEERTFALTINPAEQFCNCSIDTNDRLNAVHKSTVNRLALILHDLYDSIVLYPDISLPREINYNRIPRVHYHGIITIKKDKVKMMQFILGLGRLATWFSIELDTIDNHEVWTKYITKGAKVFPSNVENFEVITEKTLKEAQQVIASTKKAQGIRREITSFMVDAVDEEPEEDDISVIDKN